MSACYKYHENQLLNTEGLFNTWVKEEAGRNLSQPVPTPQSAAATAESVLPHHRLCKDWEGMGERKERRRSFQKNWNYGDKEAAMGEGWGLPKGECVEQIICHKSLCCCSWQNNLLGFFFFHPPQKVVMLCQLKCQLWGKVTYWLLLSFPLAGHWALRLHISFAKIYSFAQLWWAREAAFQRRDTIKAHKSRGLTAIPNSSNACPLKGLCIFNFSMKCFSAVPNQELEALSHLWVLLKDWFIV